MARISEAHALDLTKILKCTPADLPPVFCAAGPKPLQLGVDRDLLILFPDTDPADLSRWLKWWTRRPEYLVRLAQGPYRHDVFGDDVEPIDPAQAKHALNLLRA